MRLGIFLKILIPFLVALALSGYFTLHAVSEAVGEMFDGLRIEKLAEVNEVVSRKIDDLIVRGEEQLKGLSKVGEYKLGLKLLKQGKTTRQIELVNDAVYAKEVGSFDVLIFFSYDGWIAANGGNTREYNQPPDIYGEQTEDYVGRALDEESVRSLRLMELNGEDVILSENFSPVYYDDEIVGASWMGWILDKSFVESLAQSSSYPIEIISTSGDVVISTFAEDTSLRISDYATGELDLSQVVEGSNLKLKLYVPRTNLLAAKYDLERKIYTYSAVMLIVLVIIALMIARSITLPVRRLTKAVDDLSMGKLEGEITVRSGDEIETLVDGFNKMARDLDENTRKLLHAEKVASWREVARRLAHEIKNPLSPIQLSIQSLMKNYERGSDDFASRLQEDGVTILEEVDRLRRLADEFSAFAKLPKPLMEESNLNEVVESVTRMHGDETGGVKVVSNLDDELPPVRFDREQIKQVLINLVKNGCEAIEGNGEVRVTTLHQPRTGYIEIAVKDNGSGMTEEELTQVFNPYFTTKRGGTGLGLAIALSIVNDHGGRLWVESRKGSGTTFHVELRKS